MAQSLCTDIESDPSFTSLKERLQTFVESFVNPSDIYKRTGIAGTVKTEDYISAV